MCNNVIGVECKYCCNKCRRPDSNYKVQNNWYKKYDTNLDAILHTGTLFGGSTHKRITKQSLVRLYGLSESKTL